MKTMQLTKSGFLKRVADYENNPTTWKFLGNRPTVIDFYANWCGPCKMMAPIMDELAEEYSGKVDFYKVDTEAEQELAAVFGIRSIPTFLFIPLNEAPQLASGAMGKAQFKQAIESVLLKG
jgi:thioredoxin